MLYSEISLYEDIMPLSTNKRAIPIFKGKGRCIISNFKIQ